MSKNEFLILGLHLRATTKYLLQHHNGASGLRYSNTCLYVAKRFAFSEEEKHMFKPGEVRSTGSKKISFVHNCSPI